MVLLKKRGLSARIALILAFFLLAPIESRASKTIKVIDNGAEVRIDPNSNSKILEKANSGNIYRSSSLTKNGFYKVELLKSESQEKFGWIAEDQVELTDSISRSAIDAEVLSDLRSQTELIPAWKREPKRKKFSFELYQVLYQYQPTDLQNALRATNEVVNAGSSGIEVGYRFNPFYSLYIEYNIPRGDISDPLASKIYSVYSQNALLHLEYTLIRKGVLKWGGAVGFGAAFSANAATPEPGSGLEISSRPTILPAAAARSSMHWYMSESWSIGMKVGYFYAAGPIQLGLTSATLSLSGFYGQLGVRYDLFL